MNCKALVRWIENRIVSTPHVVPELDLEAPLMIPKAFVIRAILDRMRPGQEVILRSRDLEVPWEVEHLCNRLGHELVKVEREEQTCWFTLRAREKESRPAFQDPFELKLTPQRPLRTLEISSGRRPEGIGAGRNRMLPG